MRVWREFQARNSSQLSLEPGQIIRVVDRDGGSWRVEVNGRVGSVPRNCVAPHQPVMIHDIHI